MNEFTLHNSETAPNGSRELLASAEKGFGFVPNLLAVMAESPAALASYMALDKNFDDSSFTPVEKQVVLLSVSRENGCGYCMAGHSVIAEMKGVPNEVVDALRNSTAIPDDRLEALSQFTLAVVEKRGSLDSGDIDAFLSAGFTRSQMLDVLVGVAMKTISNYMNHIAETPLDEVFAARQWSAGG